ncbi:hypothetical protein SAMN04489860_0382 [Paraoerskovia marina]|uniref:HicB family protein n=1 Tax=Paraoerskovia marina TaxID=545619 RepID=A0A1H1MZ89_9CELL|nr:histidine kinase [Paraoerskovia marina]SDR91992.1 hypothetical protein SAMN04489860_0382 [Paraoerskovia marina]
MDLSRYVSDLQDRLDTAAEATGSDAQELARRLTAPLDAAVRLVLLDALSEAASEISAELAPGSVDLRLRAGDPEFVVTSPDASPPVQPTVSHDLDPAPVTDAPDLEPGTTSRTTLRLPDHLKSRAESAAARDGVSVNTWLVRAVGAALEQPSPVPAATDRRGANRLTGWVR